MLSLLRSPFVGHIARHCLIHIFLHPFHFTFFNRLPHSNEHDCRISVLYKLFPFIYAFLFRYLYEFAISVNVFFICVHCRGRSCIRRRHCRHTFSVSGWRVTHQTRALTVCSFGPKHTHKHKCADHRSDSVWLNRPRIR